LAHSNNPPDESTKCFSPTSKLKLEVSMDLEIIGKVIEVLMGGGDFSFPGG